MGFLLGLAGVLLICGLVFLIFLRVLASLLGFDPSGDGKDE